MNAATVFYNRTEAGKNKARNEKGSEESHAKRPEPKAETALSYENTLGTDGQGASYVRQRPYRAVRQGNTGLKMAVAHSMITAIWHMIKTELSTGILAGIITTGLIQIKR